MTKPVRPNREPDIVVDVWWFWFEEKIIAHENKNDLISKLIITEDYVLYTKEVRAGCKLFSQYQQGYRKWLNKKAEQALLGEDGDTDE